MLASRITLIIKVTNACNLKCKYCFIEPSVFHKTMPLETALRVVHDFLHSTHFESVHFVWHGGEPLLRGMAFFEAVLDTQRRIETHVHYENSVQTNATYLTPKLLDLLVDRGVNIGLSLDGPAGLNDASRPGRTGAVSAHAATVAAGRELAARGRRPGVIAVVSHDNVGVPDAVWGELKREGLDAKLNPVTRSGLAALPGADTGIDPEEYGAFLVRMFDLWFDDPTPTIALEPFAHHVARIIGAPGVAPNCFYARSCHRYFLGISPDGDLYPCGMFQAETAFRYGNLHQMRPEDVGNTTLFQRIDAREKVVLEGCSACAYFDLCYGGCMFHSLKDSAVLAEKDPFCGAYKTYFGHAVARIHERLSAG